VSVSGPVFSEFSIAHALGKDAFSTRVRLYKGLRRIDVRTEITNQEASVRYRAVFPTAVANGVAVHEIPFGAIERPRDEEFPAQNWVDYSDQSHGLTLINRGIPGNNISSGGEMMLSLMRSAHVGDYDPSMPMPPSDTGLELGKTLDFEYALMPHTGGWSSAMPWRAGLEFNNPLIVRVAAAHDGALAPTWGLVEISRGDVVLSALKQGKNGTTILRVYEAEGKPSEGVRIAFHTGIGKINEANLIEDVGSEIHAVNNAFDISLKPFEIRTFKIVLRPALE
jgi:alpha-mannosidase